MSDFSQVDSLARSIAVAATRAQPEIRKVLGKSGQNIKSQLQREAAGGGASARRLSATIGYDMLGPMSVEVGPARGGAGSVALLYFGNSKTGPVLPDPVEALNKEATAAERFLAEALAKAFR